MNFWMRGRPKGPPLPAIPDADDTTASEAERDELTEGAPDSPDDHETLVLGDGGAHQVEGRPALLGGDAPDSIVDWGTVGGVRVRAASVRGRMHRYEGTVRQDAFHLGISEGPDGVPSFLVLAVADGVGSLPMSHLGADVAARAGVEFLAGALRGIAALEDWNGSDFWASVGNRVVEAARTARGNPDLDASGAAQFLAATLVVAAVRLAAGADGRREYIAGCLGDASAWVLRGAEGWNVVLGGKDLAAEVAETRTPALPVAPPDCGRWATGFLAPGEALFLFSDGIGDPMGDGQGIVARELARRWADPPPWTSFLRDVDFARRSHLDDRTGVGVWAPRSCA